MTWAWTALLFYECFIAYLCVASSYLVMSPSVHSSLCEKVFQVFKKLNALKKCSFDAIIHNEEGPAIIKNTVG